MGKYASQSQHKHNEFVDYPLDKLKTLLKADNLGGMERTDLVALVGELIARLEVKGK